MKLTKEGLHKFILETIGNYGKEDIVQLSRKNILGSIKGTILATLDILEMNRGDKNGGMGDKDIIGISIDKTRREVRNVHPDILMTLEKDIGEVLEQIKKDIESKTPEKLGDFGKIEDAYRKLAKEYAY